MAIQQTSNYTRGERDKVKEVLKTLLRTRGNDEVSTETADLAQGTTFLLCNNEVTTEANLQFDTVPDDQKCSKDTGQNVRLYNWTRGIFQVVGPGGVILYWSNLYSSEGPHQSAYIMSGGGLRHTFSGPSVLYSSLVIQNRIKKIFLKKNDF